MYNYMKLYKYIVFNFITSTTASWSEKEAVFMWVEHLGDADLNFILIRANLPQLL